MSGFVDFKELKSSVSIEQVVQMLGLTLKKHGDQLRGKCPIHHGTNDREFVITPSKGLFFCFGGCGGGDMIKLVAALKGCDQQQAAHLIAEHFGFGTVRRPGTVPSGSGTVNSTGNSSPQPAGTYKQAPPERVLQPLSYLEPAHDLVQGLGVSPATAEAFGAGYAPKGIMRGRLAIPIHDRAGKLLAYCGRAVRDESPALTFPNGFESGSAIFNAHQVSPGELRLVRDPLQVLTAFESGIENVVAFLTETLSAQQLEMLASLMDEKQCESLEIF